MKLKNLTPITLAVLISFFSANITQAETTWYPFPLADTLSVSSPANVGALVLDAPAGKHGFLTVKNGHFVFSNGTPVQFWGTGIVMQGAFPTKEEAKLLVDKIAFLGFNAVRINNMEFTFAPYGIYKDTNPTATNPQLKPTGTLDEKQMDKLDYLIYLLKMKGIYVVIDLLNGRAFTEADKFRDAAKFLPGARPISLTEPFLIEAQINYAKNLLTHYNPYTQLQYRNDPAIAYIELNNEVSLLEQWRENKLNGLLPGQTSALPAYHVEVLNWQWNNYLRWLYGTPEGVKDAWAFKGNTADIVPVSTASDISLWKLEYGPGTAASKTINGTQVIIDVAKVNGTAWAVQFNRYGLNLKTDKSYQLKFTGSATIPVLITLDVKAAGAPLKASETLSLSTTPKNFNIVFNPKDSSNNAQVTVNIGRAVSKIKIENLTITEYPLGALADKDTNTTFNFARPLYTDLPQLTAQKTKDITAFYNGLQIKYFQKLNRVLKTDIGIKFPLVGISGTKAIEDIPTMWPMDIIDFHYYWDHPIFPAGSLFNTTNFTIPNISMLTADPAITITGKTKAKQALVPSNKALTVGEWNHCFPSDYAFETPVYLAAEQKKFGWDALLQYSFTHYADMSQQFQKINGFFDIAGNTQQQILTAIGAFLVKKAPISSINYSVANGVFTLNSPYVQGTAGAIAGKTTIMDNFTVTASDNAAIFVYPADNAPIATSKKLLITIAGKTKNTNGGRTSPTTYNLGTAPVLLQKVASAITIKNPNVLKAYALRRDGTRDKLIHSETTNGSTTLWTKDLTTPWIELNVQ